MSSSVVTRLEQLVVDQSDPFFFDHPLDHVPGILLFDGLLEAARDGHAGSTGDAEPARIRAVLDFTKLCELDQPTTLSCSPAQDHDGWSAAADQDGRAVCSGTFEFELGPQAAYAHAAREFAAPPAPAELVHRARPENILLSALTRPPIESLLLTPPHGHTLLGLDPQFRSVLELVEAGRQLMVMLAHTEDGAPMDVRILWVSLTIDIPARIPRHVPLLLRCVEHRSEPPRVISRFQLADAATGAELGVLTYVNRNVAAALYARMRAR